MRYYRLTTLLLIISIIHSVRSKRKLKEQEIIQRILKDYDWRVRPRGMNATWPVQCTVHISRRVTDQRLAYERYEESAIRSLFYFQVPPFVVLATSENADQSQQIWMPDTFFQNEKEARRHLIDKPNVLIRIHKNGQILYSVRLSLVLSCPMSLEFYPLDRQNCLIDLASYAYTTQDIKYEWKDTKPIQQKDGLRQSLPSFELQDVVTDYCTSLTNTGEYSCLRTRMVLRREFSYYLLQLYIPSFMLVIVSWVSFWLDKDSVPARVTLGVTTLLTMTTQSSGINAKLPPVSYTKAIDVWIGVCLAFIFGALLEFALVNYAARKDMTQVSQRIRQMKQLPTDGYRPLSASQGRSSFCCRIFVRRYKERSKRIDVVSRLVFPIGYACFNGEYSCARVVLRLRREYSYYLIQLYIPCIMLVVVSWVSFWLDKVKQFLKGVLYLNDELKDAVPARVSLGVTTLLTMTTQASGINSKLPPVSYIKAVDVWIGVCLAFIFGALLEYAVVNYYGRKEFLRKEKKKKTRIDDCVCPSDRPPLRLDLSAYRGVRRLPIFKRISELLSANIDISRRVDLMSRLTFPLTFFSFLIFYYQAYVKQSRD
ncbi:CBN-GLC-2 protein [Caenorhabditis brenneri]|uniref:CBN-GLC-2 protein n=1 Tax=Caenorhabditis brenneri TaxID=135651 RepID=G0MNG1_CAEBE|nr:CBN-GLC-2 protein [Caenorhabditis brenneri]